MKLEGFLKDYYNSCRDRILKRKLEVEKSVKITGKEIKFLEKFSLNESGDRERLHFLDKRLRQRKVDLDKILISEKNLSKASVVHDYSQLGKHTQIEKVELEKDLIVIITKKLTVWNKNIGNYKIEIPMNVYGIRISNLEGTVRRERADYNLDHWFVEQGRNPCFDGWHSIILGSLEKGNLYLAIANIIQFLLSTGNRGYISCENWMAYFNGEPLPARVRAEEREVEERHESPTISPGATTGDFTA